MESVEQVIKRMKGEEQLPTERQQRSSQGTLPSVNAKQQEQISAVRRKYGSFVDFLKANNPDRQMVVGANPDQCFLGCSPSLRLLNASYGQKAAATWLTAQLQDVNLFFNMKESADLLQVEKLAGIIAINYAYLTVDELLLFFFRFNSGRYRRFFSYFDPSVITDSIRDFLQEKYRFQKQQEEERKKREWEEHKKRAITREEYLKLKNGTTENEPARSS